MSHPAWRLGRPGLGLLAGCLLLAGSVQAETRPTANDCMSFDRSEQDHAIEYRLTNGCDQRVACTVTWKLSCGDRPPLVTHAGRGSTLLDPSASDAITASAAACGEQSWRISDVAWSCAAK